MALSPARRREARLQRRRRLERRTYALGAAAVLTAGAVIGGEVARVWRRGSAQLPAEAEDVGEVIEAAEEATVQTVEVVLEGYRQTSARENALFNMLVSFTLTFAIARLSTHRIRTRGSFGPFRDMIVGERHVHHFVPGIGLLALAGGISVATRNEDIDKWMAVPFGVGLGLTLDESALLLQLDDVYWSEEGIVSVQITLGAIGLLSSLLLALRLLRRGEQAVLEGDAPAPPSAAEVLTA